MSDTPSATHKPSSTASVPTGVRFGERSLAVGRRLRSLAETDDIVDAAIGEVACALGLNRTALIRTSRAGTDLQVAHEWAADGLPRLAGPYARPDDGYFAELARGLDLRVDDVHADPRLAVHAAALCAASIRSFAAVACIDENDLLAIAVVASDAPRNWAAEELAFVRSVVEQSFREVERGKHRRLLAFGAESLRLATDAAEVGVWDLDLLTDVLSWSDRVKAMFGISADAACSMDDFYRGLHPDDLAATSEAFAAALDPDRRAVYNVQYRTIGKEDGVVRWVAARGKGIFDDKGRGVRAIGTAIDITADRRNAQAWRDAHSLNTLILESSRDCIVVLDLQGNTEFVSPGGVEGMEIADVPAVLGKWWPRVWTGADHDAALAALDEARNGRIGHFQGYCPTHRGVPKWWDLVISVLPGSDGKPNRLVSIGRDITNRKTAEIRQAFRLKLSNSLLTQHDAGEIVALAGRLLGSHLAVERVGFGYVTPDDAGIRLVDCYLDGVPTLEGTWPLTAFRPETVAQHRRGTTTVCNDLWQVGAPSRERSIVGRAYVGVPLLQGGAFRASFYVGQSTPRDWTRNEVLLVEEVAARLWDSLERRRAEAELKASNDRLEQRIVQALAEREEIETALRQSQKMEAVGQLTGGIAHDFNNLLQVISGNLQLLARDIVGQERAERRVVNALAGAQRGAKLASQLLAFSRRQPLDPKVINVGRLVAGMDEMLRRSLGEAVEIETIVAGGLWNTLADPTQIENAILNMAINARDAMPAGGRLTIEVGNASLDEAYVRRHGDVNAGQYIAIALTDTGSGMPPDVMAKVFEPFFSTKAEGHGTGLGLSMVYGFVKQSGGHVKVYSEVGHGTTIKLYLPRNLQSEDVLVEVDGGQAPGGTATILVTEDDAAVRETVVELLADLGYRVLKANDAAGALAIIESGIPIDLLFTDVVMPGTLKSPELARRVRARYPRMAILFTSGYTANAIVHGGRLDAGVELLVKPYTREQLARKLHQVLANQAQCNLALAPAIATLDDADAIEAAATPMRILLVEDDELIRRSTSDLLTSLGHGVVAVASAEEGMKVIGGRAFDLVMTDLRLPGMSGEAFVALAKAELPDVQVLFATGDSGRSSVRFESTVLRKPYDRAALVACLRRIDLNRAETRRVG